MENLNGYVTALDYAVKNNTTLDVIVTLIKENRLPAIRNDAKWYVNEKEIIPVSPSWQRYIHMSNQIRKIWRDEGIKIREPRPRGITAALEGYHKNNLRIYYDPLNRRVYNMPGDAYVDILEEFAFEGISDPSDEEIVSLMRYRTYKHIFYSYMAVNSEKSTYIYESSLEQLVERMREEGIEKNFCWYKGNRVNLQSSK